VLRPLGTDQVEVVGLMPTCHYTMTVLRISIGLVIPSMSGRPIHGWLCGCDALRQVLHATKGKVRNEGTFLCGEFRKRNFHLIIHQPLGFPHAIEGLTIVALTLLPNLYDLFGIFRHR
jgi:hypothetical protein